MIGISSTGKERIAQAVEDMFDRLAIQLLGHSGRKKSLVFATKSDFNLANLFVSAMKNKPLNEIERDVLKGLLDTARGYVDSLKSKTQSNVTDRIDAAIREAKAKKSEIGMGQIHAILKDEMAQAKSHIKAIVESESTKMRNMGTAMDISRVAADLNDPDPTCFFIVIKDGKTCFDCMRLHVMPDGITPRLWKLSELKASYGKRGDDRPSMINRHPHCRCALTYLSKGFGFDASGRVKYVTKNYDAIKDQR